MIISVCDVEEETMKSDRWPSFRGALHAVAWRAILSCRMGNSVLSYKFGQVAEWQTHSTQNRAPNKRVGSSPTLAN
jgi:hypothetical protein